jgi:hypothetical protein
LASKSAASRQRGCIENLLGVFAQGTKSERQKGLLYYATQRDRVQKLGLKYGFTLEASAGAFAALSPNKRESDTYSDLDICMAHIRSELAGKPRVCAYPRNREKALLILRGKRLHSSTLRASISRRFMRGRSTPTQGSSASIFQRTAWRNADCSTAFVYSIVRADNPRSNI